MVGSIPDGLTLLTAEKHLLSRVTKDFNDPANKLAEMFQSVEFQQKAQEKFNLQWQKKLLELQAENAEYIKEMQNDGASKAEIRKQQQNDEKKIKEEEHKARRELNKSLQESVDSIANLKQGLDDSLKSYRDFQEQVKHDIKRLKESGATDQEIAAYLKQNKDYYDENTKSMISALDKFKDELSDLANNENVDAHDKYILNKQLRMLEKSYDLQEANFNKQAKIFQEMNDDLEQLRESDEEQRRKNRRQTQGKFKDTLLTMMLGPLRGIVDPIAKAFNSGKDTFESLQARTEKAEERYEIYEKTRAELNKLAEERREESRLAALMAGVGTTELDKTAITDDGAKALIKPLMLPSPITEELSLEQGHQDTESIMDSIAPDQNSLLSRGGVVGAGVVFLAQKLGLISDSFESARRDSEGGGILNNAVDFIKRNGLGLLKVAAPLAVTALGGVMIARGLDLQRRDTEDARGHFEEGNLGRAIETFILGDRSRITEETANEELARTAEKSFMLTGGAGLVAAGGAGTAAMVGTVAKAGGLAAAGGLGAVGAKGLAAMGAVFPPALIAAAVVTAGMVVAKGVQTAFELGWDENQATIQKELHRTMLSEDSTFLERLRAGAESTWKGFTGGLAGGIREAGRILDAESMLQNKRQIEFIKEQAEAGNERHQRLLAMMQNEQFKAMNEAEQRSMMQAEGLYGAFREAQEATRKTIGEHLLTAGRTVGGFFTGLIDTTMEGRRGRDTAIWEMAALRGMEDMTGEDVYRLQHSEAYREAIENGGDHRSAMQAAFLSESREVAIARGDLREDGMAVRGGGLLGMLGFGDTGMAFRRRQSDEEFRQTFEFSRRKVELMAQGMTAEEADLAAIEEQNALYEEAMTLRLKQSREFRETFDRLLEEGKSIKEAEEEALRVARANRRNTMTTNELIRDRFTMITGTLRNWAGNIGNFFRETFEDGAGEGFARLGNIIKEGAQNVWGAVSEWFSGLWSRMGDAVSTTAGRVSEGWDSLRGRAGDAWNWASGLFSGDDTPDDRIEDGIITKDGKVIKLSPDDNVYATKNEPKVIRDQEAQRAMPDVPTLPSEFTDAGIIAAIQVLTEVLRNKDMTTNILPPEEGISFDQFKMAEALA